jgi:hypothetical protein
MRRAMEVLPVQLNIFSGKVALPDMLWIRTPYKIDKPVKLLILYNEGQLEH